MSTGQLAVDVAARLYTDLEFYSRAVFRDLHTQPAPPVHHDIYQAIDDPDIPFLNVDVPRGTAKSTITEGYVCQRITRNVVKGDWDLGLILGESKEKAEERISNIKDHLRENETLRGIHEMLYGTPDLIKWERRFEFETHNSCRWMARGMEQAVIGAKRKAARVKCIVFDDAESLKNANTPEKCARNREHIDQSVMPMRDPLCAKVVWLGTKVMEGCYQDLIGKPGSGWHTIFDKIIRDDGSLMWPERFSSKWLEAERSRMAAVGSLDAFYISYFGTFRNPHTRQFSKRKHFGAWKTTEEGRVIVFSDERWRPVEMVAGLDTASSLDKDACFTAIQPVGVDHDGFQYVFPATRGRYLQAQIVREVFEADEKYGGKGRGGFKKLAIDAVQAQTWITQALRASMPEHDQFFTIREFKRYAEQKLDRLSSMTHDYERGLMFHLAGQCGDLERELDNFPRSATKDVMDALWLAKQVAKVRPEEATVDEETDPDLVFVGPPEIDWRTL